MKRHPFGTNFDLGIPLINDDDFNLLYVEVETYKKLRERFLQWRNGCQKGMLAGGQIGIGKTTIITKLQHDLNDTPTVTINFDRDSVIQTTGGFLFLLLREFLVITNDKGLELPDPLFLQALCKNSTCNWNEFLSVIKKKTTELYFSPLVKDAIDNLDSDTERYLGPIKEILQKVLSSIQNSWFLAAGLDKFPPDSAEWFFLEPCFSILADFPTLFEVNASHMFKEEQWKGICERLFINPCTNEEITMMLKLRFGDYAKVNAKLIDTIALWSGGIPRQAIRIASASQSLSNAPLKERLSKSLQQVTNDFFAYTEKPNFNLLRTVENQQYLGSGILNLPTDAEGARMAVCGNWLILKGEPNESDTKWPARVNPLIKCSLNQSAGSPVSDEMKNLIEYIEAIESRSRSMPAGTPEEKTRNLQAAFGNVIEVPLKMNITDILDSISAALLRNDRADRIIIGYKDISVMKAARDYLIAQANVYELNDFKSIEIPGGDLTSTAKKTVEITDKNEKIISLEFGDLLNDEELVWIDKQRDLFQVRQMLWWIPAGNLKKYLSKWIHLRQLFNIFILEDELLGSLSPDEIRSDLQTCEELLKSEHDNDSQYRLRIEKLHTVLQYLENKGTHDNKSSTHI
jgi:hypothetical protein